MSSDYLVDSFEQTKELIDEEINIEPLPFAPKRKTN